MSDSSERHLAEPPRMATQRRHCSEMVAAYRALLGDAPESYTAERIYGDTLHDLDRLDTPNQQTIASLAIVGHVGAGKTWLTRCFLAKPQDNRQILGELRSGEHEDTQHAMWLGPELPANAGNARHIYCPADRLIDLGRPYVVCDSPGYTHTRAECRDHASGALVDSQIKLFVTGYESLRAEGNAAILKSCEGAIVVPVIRLPTTAEDASEPSAAAQNTVRNAIEKWKAAAPSSRLSDPIFMPNEYTIGHDNAVRAVQDRLRSTLTPLLADARGIETSLTAQAEHRVAWADRQALQLVDVILTKSKDSLYRLDEATREMSDDALHELVGNDTSLEAVIRQELRKACIRQTWDGFFPYKPFLRTLAVTAGAWDRLLFLTTGSLPSLAMTALQIGKNLRDNWQFMRRFNFRLAKRLEATLAAKLQPDLRTLAVATAPSDQGIGDTAVHQPDIRVHGVEELQECSRAIFAKVVAGHTPRQSILFALGAVAFALFLALMCVPVASTFWAYITSCITVGSRGFSSLDFTLPTLSMFLGAAAISAAPSVVLAWLAMLISCSGGRVKSAAGRARSGHEQEITQRLSDNRLRFEVLDPRITALRKLLALRSTFGPQKLSPSTEGA